MTKEDCNFQYKVGDRTYFVNGCFVDSLENGYWKNMDSLDNFLSEGNYDHGILTGSWKYRLPDKKEITFSWKKYESARQHFVTSIPSSFTRIEDHPTFTKFNQHDTTEKLTVIVSVQDATNLGYPIDSFYLQGESEIEAKGFKYMRNGYPIHSGGNVYYMNEYLVDKGTSSATVFNLYSLIPGNRLAIITVNFSSANDQFARIIFTTIFGNLFVDGRRFLKPYEEH